MLLLLLKPLSTEAWTWLSVSNNLMTKETLLDIAMVLKKVDLVSFFQERIFQIPGVIWTNYRPQMTLIRMMSYHSFAEMSHLNQRNISNTSSISEATYP